MSGARLDDPVLAQFVAAVRAAYGARLERIVLFGSRARGDFRPDSDYDIAVFVHEPEGFHTEAMRLAGIEADIMFDTGAVINGIHFPAGAYDQRTGLMAELRRDGIDL
jgi:predicted nucleotidyltransferase